jgi:hypothetical protein
MKKTKIPTEKQLVELLVDELKEYEIGLAGELEVFSKNLYKSFKRYIRGIEYKDKLLYEFVFLTVDTLLYDTMPSQRTDSSTAQVAAGD